MSLRILVVESDPAVSELLIELLIELGHDATSVSNPGKALTLLETGHFDLMFADCSLVEFNSQGPSTNPLPAVDGLALAKAAREDDPRLKIILLTGFEREVVSTPVSDGTVDMIISKPFSLSEVEAALVRLFAV